MARLTESARKNLTKAKFALPPKKSGDAKTPSTVKGRFPIPDPAHARDALARASGSVKRGTITPAQASTIKARVKKAFPSIK